jgi:hypothetical protein
MSESPWTDLEPEPGDFDADLETIDPRFIDAPPLPVRNLTLIRAAYILRPDG